MSPVVHDARLGSVGVIAIDNPPVNALMGLDNVYADVKRFHERRGFFRRPAPLLEKLGRDGRRFADLGAPRR